MYGVCEIYLRAAVGSLKVNSMNTLRFLAGLALAWLVVVPCDAQNWERFRGPNGSGVAPDAKLPTTWTEDDYQWKVKLAGEGSSSPVVWGDKVFVTSSDLEATLRLQCLDLKTGTENWASVFESKRYPIHRQNSFASSTPAVDADHVYVTFASPDHTMLLALDHQGKTVWKRDFGRWISQHGFGASPMVYGDLVLFCNSQQAQQVRRGARPGKSEVIAVDRMTGKDVWRAPLNATRACYAMLCVYQSAGQPDQLVGTNTGDGFYGIDPETGKRVWESRTFDKRTVASTFTAGGLVFGSNGSGGGGNYLVAVRPKDKTAEEVYRVTRNANYVPSPIAVGSLLFLFGDRGVVSCLDLNSGELHWRQRVGRGFSGSPVANDTHVYCMDQQGTAHVIKADPKFELASSNDLGEPSRATPAIVGNQILFRTESHLISLGANE